jgi:hypothetical protein
MGRLGASLLERSIAEGDNPVAHGQTIRDAASTSRVAWECSPKQVVYSIES